MNENINLIENDDLNTYMCPLWPFCTNRHSDAACSLSESNHEFGMNIVSLWLLLRTLSP